MALTPLGRDLRSGWNWPVGVAVLTMAGLLSALLGESLASKCFSWISLSIPLLLIVRFWPLRRLFDRKVRR